MKVVYICAAQIFGSLGSGPSLKMGAFRAAPRKNEGWGLELKITKKRILLKVGSFGAARVGKWNKQMYMFEKGGLSVRSRSKKWSL